MKRTHFLLEISKTYFKSEYRIPTKIKEDGCANLTIAAMCYGAVVPQNLLCDVAERPWGCTCSGRTVHALAKSTECMSAKETTPMLRTLSWETRRGTKGRRSEIFPESHEQGPRGRIASYIRSNRRGLYFHVFCFYALCTSNLGETQIFFLFYSNEDRVLVEYAWERRASRLLFKGKRERESPSKKRERERVLVFFLR